jgi:hypothetical protein
VILDNVDSKKRFQIVRFRDGILELQHIAEFGDEILSGGSNGKIVYMDAEIYLFSIWVETEE